MKKRVRLDTISVRDLSRNPGKVLERVLRGERLIVCSHRRPVATLQPMTGCVVQPFQGAEYDIFGSPLGDASAEVAKLDEIERELIVRGQDRNEVRNRFVPHRLGEPWTCREISEATDRLLVRGVLRRMEFGLRLTGRGWILHETLLPPRPVCASPYKIYRRVLIRPREEPDLPCLRPR